MSIYVDVCREREREPLKGNKYNQWLTKGGNRIKRW